MSKLYDDTCPACQQPVPRDADDRVCCSSCYKYHHGDCWNGSCHACAGTRTLGDHDATRRGHQEQVIQKLIALTILDAGVWLASFFVSLPMPLDDDLALDLLKVGRWLLLLPIFVVLTQGPSPANTAAD